MAKFKSIETKPKKRNTKRTWNDAKKNFLHSMACFWGCRSIPFHQVQSASDGTHLQWKGVTFITQGLTQLSLSRGSCDPADRNIVGAYYWTKTSGFCQDLPWIYTMGSALDGAVFDIAQILAYLVHNMSRSQSYLGFGHFGWLPYFFGQ